MGLLFNVFVGIIAAILVLEYFKHSFIRRTAKLVIFLFLTVALLLFFSSWLEGFGSLGENPFIKTGAAVARDLQKNLPEGAPFNLSFFVPNTLFKN